jgi:hypothetical protein
LEVIFTHQPVKSQLGIDARLSVVTKFWNGKNRKNEILKLFAWAKSEFQK